MGFLSLLNDPGITAATPTGTDEVQRNVVNSAKPEKPKQQAEKVGKEKPYLKFFFNISQLGKLITKF